MADDKKFWQLVNLRGSVENKPVGLFGTDANVATSDTAVIDSHLVLVSPKSRHIKGKLEPGQLLPTLEGDEMIASRLQGKTVKHADSEAAVLVGSVKGRWPFVKGQVYWSDAMFARNGEIRHFDCLTGDTHDIGERAVTVFYDREVENTQEAKHGAFYKAAQGMRDKFKSESLEILKRVPEETRRYAQIVTLVDTPIWADVLDEGSGSPGVVVRVAYTQYVIVGECDPRRWQVYSKQGEYPMDIPKTFDIEFLTNLDKKVLGGRSVEGLLRK